MSCYDPLAMWRGFDLDTGEVIYKFLGYYDPEIAKESNKLNYSNDNIIPTYYKIPCGKCLGCKLDYARHWADRMIMELESYNGKAIFLTLTYNNDNLPKLEKDNGSIFQTLCKKDLQDFFKRLREHYCDRKLRYFASGEYGGQTLRPHYHAIIYGLTLEDFKKDIRPCQKNELGQLSFTSLELEKIWSNGFILFSEVSYDTMAYVSRYSAKKVFGDNLKPNCLDCEDTFVLMSRRPGIGHDFIISHKELYENRKMFVSDSVKPRVIYFPRYGNKILDKEDTLEYYVHVREGTDRIIDRDLLKLWKTDLPFDQLMKVEEAEKKIKVARLLKHRKEI